MPFSTTQWQSFVWKGYCLLSSEEEKKRILRWKSMYAGIQSRARKARARTARSFDNIANRFISDHPGCTVINLACGLDTRFWRIEHEKCNYIELDLPEMIEVKREILKDHLDYELIGCSVLDTSWIDQVTSNGNSNFLLLAEGLIYYLPRQEASGLLQAIAKGLLARSLSLIWPLKNTQRDYGKGLCSLESKAWDIDVSFVFGFNHPRDIKSYGNGFKVVDVVKGSVGSIITASINAA